jgi:hypothetical protein
MLHEPAWAPKSERWILRLARLGTQSIGKPGIEYSFSGTDLDLRGLFRRDREGPRSR